ncbi:inositol-pentakisphosphate 2-kinase-domain-containing protein [Stachybotrys elegans]|uniref:Inositol-pentakisphosphate 2-kinase n=1 Tax=Stachybotrys elegans TaxID=80388 RepID=A0A8K0WWQ5_9HYPO|nr:inositol-pentakisphosphate 2-kinase-domain-containing protein [Stachybotrys elegans]
MANAASKLHLATPSASPKRTSFDQTSRHEEDGDDDDWISPQHMAILQEILKERGAAYRTYIKTLPKGTKPVKFVGEGAANAVFEIQIPDNSPNASDFKGLLLRVAKVTPGQPMAFDYVLQQRFWTSNIQPILKNHAASQELVILHKSEIIDQLNALLRSIDQSRRPKFRGTYVGHSDWGLLVEDMRPEKPEEALLFEFKPKWLLQSRSAPPGAIRCRQCAMELYHFIKDPASYRRLPQDKPCPLGLADESAHERFASPARITHLLSPDEPREPYKEALRAVANHDAIPILRSQQKMLDHMGPLHAGDDDWSFSLAMTLRDCTCFAQISRQPHGGKVKVRYGDFDWKDPKIKACRWREAEQKLIEGGFYTADWILYDQTYYHPPTTCLLEWKPRKSNAGVGYFHIQDKAKNHSDAASTALVSQLKRKGNVFHHKTDSKVLKPLLEKFKKEPQSLRDSAQNPYRAEP